MQKKCNQKKQKCYSVEVEISFSWLNKRRKKLFLFKIDIMKLEKPIKNDGIVL